MRTVLKVALALATLLAISACVIDDGHRGYGDGRAGWDHDRGGGDHGYH